MHSGQRRHSVHSANYGIREQHEACTQKPYQFTRLSKNCLPLGFLPPTCEIEYNRSKQAQTRRRRRKSRTKLRKPINYPDIDTTDSESSSSDLDVSCSRQIDYTIRDGVPGLTVYRRNPNPKWSPIAPSPIASRTRTKQQFGYQFSLVDPQCIWLQV